MHFVGGGGGGKAFIREDPEFGENGTGVSQVPGEKIPLNTYASLFRAALLLH